MIRLGELEDIKRSYGTQAVAFTILGLFLTVFGFLEFQNVITSIYTSSYPTYIDAIIYLLTNIYFVGFIIAGILLLFSGIKFAQWLIVYTVEKCMDEVDY